MVTTSNLPAGLTLTTPRYSEPGSAPYVDAAVRGRSIGRIYRMSKMIDPAHRWLVSLDGLFAASEAQALAIVAAVAQALEQEQTRNGH